MNRMEEYESLLEELEKTPEGFGSVVEMAHRRLNRRRRRKKAFLLPCASLAACFLIFVVLVNAVPSFAYACSGLPLLGELAQAVSFSPSLKAALENDYVQEMGLSQSQPGVTMNIDYLIVDQKQVNIFYTLYSSKYENIDIEPLVLKENGTALEGFSVMLPERRQNGEIRQITLDFMDQDVPDTLRLDCTLTSAGMEFPADSTAGAQPLPSADDPVTCPKTGEVLADFSFVLEFDPAFTAAGEELVLQTPVTLSDNSFCLEQIGIYPTHMNLFFTELPNNPAWLTGLSYYVENEKGERFEKIRNGISASGVPGSDSVSMLNQRLESTFFSSSKELTLVITGVELLDKDMEHLEINLDEGTVKGPLPQNVAFAGVEAHGKEYEVNFQCYAQTETPMFSPFSLPDEISDSWSTISGDTAVNGLQESPVMEGYESFTVKYYIKAGAGPMIQLVPGFTSFTELEEPLRIQLK